jgi:prepilin-type N-terminal cleavage/methylation domain-containing protein
MNMKELISMVLKLAKASDAGCIRDRGFTLIELLVAMAIASIVMAAIYSFHAGMTRSYTTQNAAADAQQAVRATIDFIAEDIMMAGFDPAETAFSNTVLPIEHAESSKLRVQSDRNVNGGIDEYSDLEIITYSYDKVAKKLYQLQYETAVDYDEAKDKELFMDNVTEFSFTYLDADGNDLGDPVPADDRDAIRTVEISMKVEEPAGREAREEMKAREYHTRVKCRNLGLYDD